MKKTFALIFLFLFLTGCAVPDDEQTAIKTAKEFKEIQYNVIDYTEINNIGEYQRNVLKKLEPYLTEDRYKKLFADREVYGLMYAMYYKSNIALEKITFEKYGENKEQGTIDFNYTMEIKFSGNINKIYTKKGQMTVVKTENRWKIDRDWNQVITKRDL